MLARACTRAMSRKPGMQMQRSTTTLTAWDMNLDAVLRQYPNRGAVQLSKRNAADAADQQCHAPAASALSRIDGAKIAE